MPISTVPATCCYEGPFNDGIIAVNWYPLLAASVNYSKGMKCNREDEEKSV